MVYLPTFVLFLWYMYIGQYTIQSIHGSYASINANILGDRIPIHEGGLSDR